MISELEQVKSAGVGVSENVKEGSLGTPDAEKARLAKELTASGMPHADMRDWLQMVDAIGELKVVEGVDWQENIGRIAEMLVHSDGAPAVQFASSVSVVFAITIAPASRRCFTSVAS